MHSPIVNQWNVGRPCLQFSVEFRDRHPASNTRRIFYFDLVDRRVVFELDRVTGPVSRNTRIDRKRHPAQTKSKNPFDARAVKPTGRTRVPRPAATPHVRRLGINITGYHVRFHLVSLHAGTGVGAMDRTDHAKKLGGFVAIAQRRECDHHPRGSMAVLPAVFPNARQISLDIAGIMIRMVEGRR